MRALSCTHDANSWPADFYAGLPAPAAGETVTLWVQNSQPCAIPAGADRPQSDGRRRDRDARAARSRPSPAMRSMSRKLLPQARWPQQIEIRAGKYLVRPRYEVSAQRGTRRIAHVNVERTDLKPDPRIARARQPARQGLPPAGADAAARPLALARPADADGDDAGGAADRAHRLRRHRARDGAPPLRPVLRRDSVAVDIDDVVDGAGCRRATGTCELVYDFAARRRRRWLAAWRCSATSTAPAATRPRPASARMSSTPC